MTNFKGTKGKWVFDDENIFSLDKSETTPMEIIANNPYPYLENPEPYSRYSNWEANALLISKAPEMLEMLEEIHHRYYDHKIEGELPITRIKELIKKATES